MIDEDVSAGEQRTRRSAQIVQRPVFGDAASFGEIPLALAEADRAAPLNAKNERPDLRSCFYFRQRGFALLPNESDLCYIFGRWHDPKSVGDLFPCNACAFAAPRTREQRKTNESREGAFGFRCLA